MKAVQSISISLAEQNVAERLDQLDELLCMGYEELVGIRDAFITYQNAMKEIVKELENDKQN